MTNTTIQKVKFYFFLLGVSRQKNIIENCHIYSDMQKSYNNRNRSKWGLLVFWKKKKVLVTHSCLTLRPHGLQPTRLLCPWYSPEYWSGQPFPSPGDLSDPGIKPAGRFFTVQPPRKPNLTQTEVNQVLCVLLQSKSVIFICQSL